MASRILVSQFIYPEAVQLLRDAGFEVDARTEDTALPPAELRARVRDADALVSLVTDRIDAELLAAAPRLSVVANVAVGHDNVDVAAATAAGVQVTNTPGVLTEACADLAFSVLLAAARRIPEADAYLRAGRYTHWTLDQPHLGADVFGRVLGIIGPGEIGRAVARRARGGFGMTVHYTGRRPLPAEVEAETGMTFLELDELLAACDFVSVHAPLTDETHHLIDADALRRMKPTAILVNTARGPVVDESALAEALETGTIAGAALDVFEDEPAVHPRLLGQRERVVLTPHIGSATTATRHEMARMAVTNVIEVLQGRRPPNPVNEV